jgi:hypothetical protein
MRHDGNAQDFSAENTDYFRFPIQQMDAIATDVGQPYRQPVKCIVLLRPPWQLEELAVRHRVAGRTYMGRAAQHAISLFPHRL